MNLRRNIRGWLLWLALILPIAQAMAGAHAFTHVSDRPDDGLVHLVDCDLCLTAAHLAGGVPAALPGPLPAPVAGDVLAAAGLEPAVASDATWRPPARAPPASV
ncbi:hypothetical protein NYO99_10765 [Pelomonas sp. UHG3]|uniref:Uncharacterized protein n=1 Tax=Roseateles hydrophilus TaxID=2975054 RepID=A0ACC6CAN7_9BURK|nr:hypothetical protein [Pelomonas sp. UHG3]MCY4745452.1 hypothetical protein [Pelomonas sp. UHG3]